MGIFISYPFPALESYNSEWLDPLADMGSQDDKGKKWKCPYYNIFIIWFNKHAEGEMHKPCN